MTDRGDTIALITGAAGGIGSACARSLGGEHRLYLNDIDEARLASLAADLEAEGMAIAGWTAGDLVSQGMVGKLVNTAAAAGSIGPVVHAAALSPSMGDASAIATLNCVGTDALLVALEQYLSPTLAVVVIASMAGHMAKPEEQIDSLCAEPSHGDFVTQVVPLLGQTGSGREGSDAAYLYSKRGNILDVQRRAPAWAAKGARINSISPGLVDTAMRRLEVEQDEGSARMLAMQPLGWVAPTDVAAAAAFLASPSARMITGTDLKVDGGVCAAIFGGRSTTGACAA